MKYFIFLFSVLITISCGSGDHYIENPLELMIGSMSTEKTFSVLLDDMDVKQGNCYHRYGIVKESKAGKISASKTEWLLVDRNFFNKNEKNLGMQLASKDSTGVVSRAVIPGGYDRYIGNQRYGSWQETSGQRTWVFFGQYMFLRSVFGLGYYPAHYGRYNSYYTGYYGTGRSYYGGSYQGGNYYGTNSTITKKNRSGFFERKARNTNWKASSSRSSSSRRSGRGGGFGFGK